MFYVNEQIPSNFLSLESIPMDIELVLLELTVKNQRWLGVGIYRPPFSKRKIFYCPFIKNIRSVVLSV